jgi:hypothetical protein
MLVQFPPGIPKIHEHDGKRPQAFALFDDYGRMMLLYTYETNISDGWPGPMSPRPARDTRERPAHGREHPVLPDDDG